MQLQGENGAKGLIATHAQQVIAVTLTDSVILRDVDKHTHLSHPPIS
jgi:molybdenum cofactor cytidylyltransferase